MSNNDDVKRMWVGGQIDETIYTALWKVSTELGKHPSVVIEMSIEEFIVNFTNKKLNEGKDVDDKLLVTTLALEDRARTNQITQLKTLAYSHLKFPTEESAERLEAACNASGISIETLLEEINENQHIKELVSENGSLSNSEMWLLENMSPGRKYPMRVIVEKGRDAGFKEHTLKAAKAKLGIESKRESHSWVWILPKNPQKGKTNLGDEIVF